MTTHTISRRLSNLAAVSLLALLSGCGFLLKSDYTAPQVTVPAAWHTTAATPIAVTSAAETIAIDNWWQDFNDPVLDALVQESLAKNNDLAAARAPNTRRAATLALAVQPDASALDVYVDGLSDAEFDVRQKCAEAIAAKRAEVKSAVEERAAQLTPAVVSRLQEIYRDDQEARGGPIFAAPAKAFDPAEYLAFARVATKVFA